MSRYINVNEINCGEVIHVTHAHSISSFIDKEIVVD